MITATPSEVSLTSVSTTSAPAAKAPWNDSSVFSGYEAEAPRCATTRGYASGGKSLVRAIACGKAASVYSRLSGPFSSGELVKPCTISSDPTGETRMEWVHRALCKDEDPELF